MKSKKPSAQTSSPPPLRDRIIGLERVRARDLRKNPANWRQHPAAQRSALRAVLNDIGIADALIARRTPQGLELIDGHLRTDEHPDTVFPVLVTNLTKPEADKLLLVLDPLAGMADTDTAALKKLMRSVTFDDKSVNAMLQDLLADAPRLPRQPKDEPVEEWIDRAAELRKKWKTARGQLWQLGEHRLLCADSTNAADISRLMAGDAAALCFTSPPYSQQRKYTAESAEKLKDWDELMKGVFGNLPLAKDGQLFVNLGLLHKDGEWVEYWRDWMTFMSSNNWKRFGWYVWDQGPGMMGDHHGRLAPAFEFVWHFNRVSRQANKTKPCAMAGEAASEGGNRRANGTIAARSHAKAPIQSHKVPDSVVRVIRHKGAIPGGGESPGTVPGRPALRIRRGVHRPRRHRLRALQRERFNPHCLRNARAQMPRSGHQPGLRGRHARTFPALHRHEAKTPMSQPRIIVVNAKPKLTRRAKDVLRQLVIRHCKKLRKASA